MQSFSVIIYKSRLVESRKRKGFSQKDVAEKLNIQRTTYSTWEQEQKTSYPNLEMLFQLCSLYDISADYLLGLTNAPAKDTPSQEDSNVNFASLMKQDFSRDPLAGLDEDLRSKGKGYIDALFEAQNERNHGKIQEA